MIRNYYIYLYIFSYPSHTFSTLSITCDIISHCVSNMLRFQIALFNVTQPQFWYQGGRTSTNLQVSGKCKGLAPTQVMGGTWLHAFSSHSALHESPTHMHHSPLCLCFVALFYDSISSINMYMIRHYDIYIYIYAYPSHTFSTLSITCDIISHRVSNMLRFQIDSSNVTQPQFWYLGGRTSTNLHVSGKCKGFGSNLGRGGTWFHASSSQTPSIFTPRIPNPHAPLPTMFVLHSTIVRLVSLRNTCILQVMFSYFYYT